MYDAFLIILDRFHLHNRLKHIYNFIRASKNVRGCVHVCVSSKRVFVFSSYTLSAMCKCMCAFSACTHVCILSVYAFVFSVICTCICFKRVCTTFCYVHFSVMYVCMYVWSFFVYSKSMCNRIFYYVCLLSARTFSVYVYMCAFILPSTFTHSLRSQPPRTREKGQHLRHHPATDSHGRLHPHDRYSAWFFCLSYVCCLPLSVASSVYGVSCL